MLQKWEQAPKWEQRGRKKLFTNHHISESRYVIELLTVSVSKQYTNEPAEEFYFLGYNAV
jgi:hypothetical protein